MVQDHDDDDLGGTRELLGLAMGVQLPDMTRYDATRRLKADPATAAIPVVAITAQAMRGEEAKAREAGCDAYLTKPVNTWIFHEVLARFLSNRGKSERQG